VAGAPAISGPEQDVPGVQPSVMRDDSGVPVAFRTGAVRRTDEESSPPAGLAHAMDMEEAEAAAVGRYLYLIDPLERFASAAVETDTGELVERDDQIRCARQQIQAMNAIVPWVRIGCPAIGNT